MTSAAPVDMAEGTRQGGEVGQPSGSQVLAPTPNPGRFARWFSDNVWAPIVLKAVGVGFGLMLLTAIGLWSESRALIRLAGLAKTLPAGTSSSWLKPEPTPPPGAVSSGAALPMLSPVSAAGGARASPAPPALAHVAGAANQPPNPTASAAVPAPATPEDSAAPLIKSGPALTSDGKIILNLAGVEELQKLPGVGAKRATAILALRTRLGKFRSINDLLRVKGIGPKGIRRMAPRLVLDPPPAAAAPPPAAVPQP